jgi:hypothetical protein
VRLGLAVLALACTDVARAQTILNFNVATGDWHSATNWLPAQVPTSNDTAQINSSRAATIPDGNSGVASNAYVGYGSGQNGTLNVNGSLTTVGDVAVAYSPNSTKSRGTVNQGAGSVVTIGGHLLVGRDNTGTGNGGVYSVADGGALALLGTASDLRVAYGSSALGTFTYSNTTATLSVPGNLTLGYSGNASYRSAGVFNQGDNTSIAVGGNLIVGGYCATGAAYNQGTNTAVRVGGNLLVGNGYNEGGLGVSYSVPASGTLALTGTASSVFIAYGANGRGTFAFSNTTAALAIPGSATVAYSSDSSRPATGAFIQGPGTAVTLGGSLTIGNSYSHAGDGGVYTMGGGATLALTGAASDLLVAYGRNARGAFAGNGPLTVARNLTVAYSDHSSYPATGAFIQDAGAAVVIGGNLTVGGGQSHTGNGGEYVVGAGSSLTVTGATAIATAANSRGRLHVNGGTVAFTGALTLGGGTGRDGQLNLNGGALHLPRATTVATGGALTNLAGQVHVGIGGDPAPGAFDQISVSGGVVTLGGELRVALEGGYAPALTNRYTLVSRSSGTLAGVFANAPDSGQRYELGEVLARVVYDNAGVTLSEVWAPPPGAPWFAATGVSNVTTTAAEAYATFGGTNADVYLVWADSDKGATLAGWSATNTLGERSPGPIDGAQLTGLATGTTYTCRFFATNAVSGLTAWSDPVTFRTSGLPLIATRPESNVTSNNAVLNGDFTSAGGSPTTVRVYWGEEDAWPNYDGWAGTNDFGEVGVGPLAHQANGLTPARVYCYRYYATNALGEAWGEAVRFTPGVPVVVTLPATAIMATTAYLNGNLVSGVTANVRVYWGTTDRGAGHGGWLASHDFGVVSQGARSGYATGLTGGQRYFYRFYATNDHGESWGEAMSLTTRKVDWDPEAGLPAVDYTTPGTYTYVVPPGVTRLQAVCIGGGGSGASTDGKDANNAPPPGPQNYAGGGGGGGGLRYSTDIPVSPGETLTVVVGAGGVAPASHGPLHGNGGGSSSIARGATTLLWAGGGSGGGTDYAYGAMPGGGGTPFGDTVGGGDGGYGKSGYWIPHGSWGGGGGGAGGYSGNGGRGSGNNWGFESAQAGSGGGGGGGAIWSGAGGGVGLFGEGASGLAGSGDGGSGGGGSGGSAGTTGTDFATGVGGFFGGGGGGASFIGGAGKRISNGGGGAVRILGFRGPSGLLMLVR